MQANLTDRPNGTRKIGPSYAKSVCMYVCMYVRMYICTFPFFYIASRVPRQLRVPREVPTLTAHLAGVLDRAIEIA